MDSFGATGTNQYRRIDITGFDAFNHQKQDNPELRWVDIAELVIDDTYQRKVESRGRKNIETIAAEFSWGRFTPLLIAPVARGKFAIIDGQHRAHAAALCGYFEVPAMVVDMTRREQAQAFSWVNGNVTNVTPFQIFRAALAAQEDWAVKSDIAVRKGGCELMTSNASAPNKKSGEIYCVGVVKRHVGEGNGKYVTAALTSLRSCRDAARPVMYSATVLRPWIGCLIEARLTNPELLVGFLNKNSFNKLLAGVDRMRDTPEYFDKSRTTLLQLTMAALFKSFVREKGMGT